MCLLIDPYSIIGPTESSYNSPKEILVVAFDYSAQSPEEFTLRKDDEIEVNTTSSFSKSLLLFRVLFLVVIGDMSSTSMDYYHCFSFIFV